MIVIASGDRRLSKKLTHGQDLQINPTKFHEDLFCGVKSHDQITVT